MGASLTLFRVYDIEVRVHWSFVLILAYGAYMYGGGILSGALYGILVTLLLFVCVTLHEFGHAFVAKYFGIRVPHITLLPIGGVASLERTPDKPLHELLITIAGPLVNFVIAAVLLPVALLAAYLRLDANADGMTLRTLITTMRSPGMGNLLVFLVSANLALGLFNLLPAFPMDGGRILRSLLAMAMPYVGATRVAVFVGRIMAILFAIWGIAGGGGIFILLIAFFVYVGGNAEQEAAESRAVLGNVRASQALTQSAANLYASEQISRAVNLLMNSYQTDYAVLDLSGKFIGVLTRPCLIHALKTSGPETRVVDVMLSANEVPKVAPTATLVEVWEKMVQQGSRAVAVLDRGSFVGLITTDDIAEIVQVMSATRDGADRGRSSERGPSPSGNSSDA